MSARFSVCVVYLRAALVAAGRHCQVEDLASVTRGIPGERWPATLEEWQQVWPSLDEIPQTHDQSAKLLRGARSEGLQV